MSEQTTNIVDVEYNGKPPAEDSGGLVLASDVLPAKNPSSRSNRAPRSPTCSFPLW